MSGPVQEVEKELLLQQLQSLKDQGLTFGDIVGVYGVTRDEDYDAQEAVAKYFREGYVEVDEETMTAPGEVGCYVMAWVYTAYQEAEEIADDLIEEYGWSDEVSFDFDEKEFEGVSEENVWAARELEGFVAFGLINDEEAEFELHIYNQQGGPLVHKITGEHYANAFNDRLTKHKWDVQHDSEEDTLAKEKK